MLDHSNGPLIPERTSARTSLSPKERKRQSLPASPQDARRRNRNRVIVTPASTEVISSLIDTLSAISSPAEHHFDALPNIAASHSTPVSPSPWHTNFPSDDPTRNSAPERAPQSPLATAFGLDDSRQKRGSVTRGNHLLHPAHGGPPVKNSLPRPVPSDRSSADLSKNAEHESTLDDTDSIGNISIEPGSTASVASHEPRKPKSIRSIRSLRSLRLQPSKDSLRKIEGSNLRSHDRGIEPTRERLYIQDSPSTSPLRGRFDLSGQGSRQNSPAPKVPARTSSTRSVTAPQRLYLNPQNIHGEPGGSSKSSPTNPHPRLIPSRDSSRNQAESRAASAKPRLRPNRSDYSAAQDSEAETIDEQFHTPPQTPRLSGSDAGDDIVVRRIRELKDQKMKRDQLSAEVKPETISLPGSTVPSPLPSPKSATQKADGNPLPTMAKKSPEIDLDGSTLLDDNEKTAPPPTIAQGIKRTNGSRINSLYSKPTIVKHSPTASRDETRRSSFNSHQRSGSRLLKRLSQPASPPSGEKLKRRVSNPLGPPARSLSYQTDGGDSIDDAVEEYLWSPRLSQTIKHPQTGRVICFSEVGDPNGSVVFCCVGMGLTRYITAFYDELAATLKLRLITPDRPGVGGSEPHGDGLDTPLGWPDDVRTICEHRRITKFSILAHSAGAIYALATALRIPQHIRCRVHLLAPWIPPSQMSAIGTHPDPLPSNALPYSQRFLRSLPTTFLRAANSSFLSVTSNSFTTSLPRTPRRPKAKSNKPDRSPIHPPLTTEEPSPTTPSPTPNSTDRDTPTPTNNKENHAPLRRGSSALTDVTEKPPPHQSTSYDVRLASAIWDAATTHANSAVDLIVCLERRQPIGFRYVDVTRAVVIHHGTKDTRVPVENVRWLGKMMRRCEVRVLEGEGHGLMASAGVMGGVLTEMAGEWEDWNRVTKG